MSDVKQKNIQSLGSISNNVFGIVTAPSESFSEIKEKKEKPIKDSVAIHSTKNIYSSGFGKILKGYNIVEKNNAEKWLKRPEIRIASPEEVAKEYGL